MNYYKIQISFVNPEGQSIFLWCNVAIPIYHTMKKILFYWYVIVYCVLYLSNTGLDIIIGLDKSWHYFWKVGGHIVRALKYRKLKLICIPKVLFQVQYNRYNMYG